MEYIYFTIDHATYRLPADAAWDDMIGELQHSSIQRVLGPFDTGYETDKLNVRPAKISVHNFNPKE